MVERQLSAPPIEGSPSQNNFHRAVDVADALKRSGQVAKVAAGEK